MTVKEKKARLLSMDELQNRPCEVDGRPALFHRWLEEDQLLFRGDIPNRIGATQEFERRLRKLGRIPECCHQLEVIRETFALVEYQDGAIDKVDPLRVRFVDKEAME